MQRLVELECIHLSLWSLHCAHISLHNCQVPTADQFCSEGWEVSLVEVPACLTVVAMVGGHGQAKKEGANCQVGRCLVFFGMTVALGGVSTAWRKQEWRGARWRLGRRLRRRRSRFPALWKKGKAFIDASEIFNRKVWLWQAVCAGLPLLTNATPQKTSHMWALPFWRCNHCFDLLRSHLIFSGRRMSVVLCQDSSQCKVSYMWARFKRACVKFFSTCYEEHDWGFEEAGTLVRCKSPQSRPCRSTRSSPATSWIDQMIMKEEWEKTSGFDMSIWWHDDIESVGWPQQGLRRRRILLWEPPIARCRKTSRSRPWKQPSWFWWENCATFLILCYVDL